MTHHNSDPQDTANQDPAATPKRKLSTLQKVGAIAGLSVVAGLAAGVTTALVRGGHEQSAAATASADYRASLEGELRTAYVGPVALTSAENTGQVITDTGGEKRGVVKIHIGGAAINEKTAKSTGDPGYYYSQQPIENMVLPNGQKFPGEVHWTDQQDGEAVMNPLLSDFSGSKPKTYDYDMQLGAYGLIPGSQAEGASGIQVMGAEYNAGEVAITGQNGKITSVEVIPRPEDVPAIQTEQGANNPLLGS